MPDYPEFAALPCRYIDGDMGPRLLFEDENGETELIIVTPGRIAKDEAPIVYDLVEEVAQRWNSVAGAPRLEQLLAEYFKALDRDRAEPAHWGDDNERQGLTSKSLDKRTSSRELEDAEQDLRAALTRCTSQNEEVRSTDA